MSHVSWAADSPRGELCMHNLALGWGCNLVSLYQPKIAPSSYGFTLDGPEAMQERGAAE